MVKTWLTQRFGLDVPVVCAPMAGVSGGALAGAVSAAGGLGMIGFSGPSPDDLRPEAAKAGASGRPFGVGVLAWALGPGDEETFDIAAGCGAVLMSVSYGDYRRHVERVRSTGMLCATQVGTVSEAREAADAGVDIVVARGGEGGGHGRDVVATLPLLQAVLDAVDVPVLAAGGIATARGLAAVLAAGAAGAWVGTAFLGCPEAEHPDDYRAAVVAARESETLFSRVFDIGRHVPWPEEFGGRAISTDFARRWHGREEELARAGDRITGRVYWAGQGVGLVTAERPAADVVAEFAEAERYLRDLAGRLG